MSAAIASRERAGGYALEEDTRPLLGASAISAVLGASWVALVLFGPRAGPAVTLLPAADPPQVVVTLAPEPPAPPVARPAPPAPPPPVEREVEPEAAAPARAPRPAAAVTAAPRAERAGAPAPADLGAAFGGTAAPVGDVSRVLSDVRVSGGSERARAEGAGRAAIAAAEEPTAAPGRGRATASTGAGIGAVTAPVAGVARASVQVSSPRAVGGDAASAGARGSGTRLGSEVRRRESQLRVCYTEFGLRADPALAGRVTLALALDDAGVVTAATVTDRSWQGAGAAAAERCLLERVRGWRMASVGGGGNYEMSFSFTR